MNSKVQMAINLARDAADKKVGGCHGREMWAGGGGGEEEPELLKFLSNLNGEERMYVGPKMVKELQKPRGQQMYRRVLVLGSAPSSPT